MLKEPMKSSVRKPRSRQGIDLILKLGVAGGKNKRTGNADKPQPRGHAAILAARGHN